MRIVIAPTDDWIKVERTKLTADAAAGSNIALALESNEGTAQNTFIVVGREGTERAELERINAAVSGNTAVQVATLKFGHLAGEPVTVYRFDKRKFYGCDTEDGSFVALATDNPKAIQVDDLQGTPIEYTGSEGYVFFKATYYNSQTGLETELADSPPTSSDESTRYATLWGIRVKAGFEENTYLTEARLEEKRIQAENEIDSSLLSKYALPLAEVPPLITNVCETLAAGYLLYEEYKASGIDNQGKTYLGEARGILKNIREGTQRLLASDKTELTPASSGGTMLEGMPNGTETTDSRRFTSGKIY